MKISREVKTGILVVLGITLFIFGFNFLKGHNLLESKNLYYTEFDYNALTKASPVTVNGNTVGKIDDISYVFETGKTRVAFTVNDQLKFSDQSVVKMYETGLMGGNGLAILVSNEGQPAQPGTVLKSTVENGLVTTLSKSFSGISTDLSSTLQSTDTLMYSLNTLVNDNSDKGLKYTVAELNETLKSFKNTSNAVNNVISKNDKNIGLLLENFKKISTDLSVLTNDLKDSNMGNTVENLNKTLASLNSVLAKVENGEGSIGKLLKDEALYNNLEGATKEMEELLRDIKLHPKRYFRILSKKEIPYEKE
ncbi:MlaD family protein [Siansivirga zeaxanthinifaciens]|uniref:Mammalian cell entry protein n=1 Tax=Siansivirga zeaxanthinifaciens CC-SAMT-1 TaxID=1454006 RepID=A0A0C5WAN4_9FLAO|nr:MlaD family protein [Siansivirga zeaxanthinifaciens]AJR04163.1 mammalian cell entry protein [Siansivirga zeaxanthinifaciens CC-SAMT-1]